MLHFQVLHNRLDDEVGLFGGLLDVRRSLDPSQRFLHEVRDLRWIILELLLADALQVLLDALLGLVDEGLVDVD